MSLRKGLLLPSEMRSLEPPNYETDSPARERVTLAQDGRIGKIMRIFSDYGRISESGLVTTGVSLQSKGAYTP